MSVEKFTDSYNSFSFEKINISMGNKQLIKDGSLSLAPEKRYGIIGKNGAGKTTLMKFINSKIGKNSIYIDQYVTTELQDWYNTNIVEIILTANTERYELIKKYKELESNESSIEDFKEVMDELHALNVDKDESEVKKILRKLGFSNVDLEKNFKEFSGGKKTRINLARALYMKPKVLLLDEPTNHLDLEAIIWLEDYLQNTSSILVVISHNVHFLNAVCTNIIYLNNSSLTTIAGNYNKFNKIRLKDLEKQSKAWDLLKKDINALKSKGKVKEAEALLKKREKEGVSRPTKPYKININFISEKNAKNPYIRIDNLNFEYPNKKIIKNLDFILEEDSRISLIGLNGCGKSTFIKLLIGELKQNSGDIIRDSNLVISYFSQHSIEALPADKTPVEYLQEKYSLSMQEIRQVLGQTSLDSMEHNKKISSLSGGQLARIVFSELIIEKPHLIFFDEPTNHLDLETIDALIDAINNFSGATVIISHDIELIERTNCDIFLLEDKTLKRLDSIDEYIEQILEE